jgi:hypothetical protein
MARRLALFYESAIGHFGIVLGERSHSRAKLKKGSLLLFITLIIGISFVSPACSPDNATKIAVIGFTAQIGGEVVKLLSSGHVCSPILYLALSEGVMPNKGSLPLAPVVVTGPTAARTRDMTDRQLTDGLTSAI